MSVAGTALAKIETAKKTGALIFVDNEWGTEKTPLYKPEVTEIKINKETECFSISGKLMPKREVVDRIGEASGVDFIFGEVRNLTIEDEACGKRTVFVAVSQGRKMMTDGSYRTSSKCEYEFDPVLRAMLDYDVTELNEQTKLKKKKDRYGKEYGSTLARYILELQKVATQRANTGARLRVVRELVGMPVAFDAKDIEKPLYFGRMVQNTEYILKTPEGRAMATAKALGVDFTSLFGPNRSSSSSLPPASGTDEEPNTRTIPVEEEPRDENDTAALAAEAGDDPDFPDPDFPEEPPSEEQKEFDDLTKTLEEYMTFKEHLDVQTKSGTNPYALATEELTSNTATIDSRNKMIARVRDFLIKKKVKGVA